MATLPTFQQVIDDAFMSAWFDMKPELVDNVMLSTPVWAILKQRGRLMSQAGGTQITWGVEYALPTTTAVTTTDELPTGQTPAETMARWPFKHFATPVMRTYEQDRVNRGEYQLRNYINDIMLRARKSQLTKFESALFNSDDTAEANTEPHSLNQLLPPYANRATGTYGLLARSNSWWQSQYRQYDATAIEVTLKDDMRNLYRTCEMNGGEGSIPNLIVLDQTLFDIYETYAEDKVQIAVNQGTDLVNTGYTTLQFYGHPVVWSRSAPTGVGMFLNTDNIKVIYDPIAFMEMTEFERTPRSQNSLAHIRTCYNLVGNNPRGNGRLESA